MLLIDSTLTAVASLLKSSGAKVTYESDDYGNPAITIEASAKYPVIARHSVIGGEEIVAIDAEGHYHSVPVACYDPFGPIPDASEEIGRLWPLVVAHFPEAEIK